MLNYKTKIFLFSVIFVLFPSTSLALRPQIDYPEIMGIDIDELMRTIPPSITLSDLARYLYYFFVVLGGVAAFWGLLMGGFQWLTSAGNPGRLSQAKDQILASFLGIILLLSSWVILNTIDPALLTLYAYPTSIDIPAQPPTIQPTELEDGFLLYTTYTLPNGKHIIIDVPKGFLQVEDTERFPYGGTTIDLGGPGSPGTEDLITEIEFRNPILREACPPGTPRERIGVYCCNTDPAGNIIQGTCPIHYYYGIICFAEPNYQGPARVITSYRGDRQSLENLFSNEGLGHRACRSIYSFKQPAIPIYARGDEVIFYENYFPIEKNLEDGSVVGRACLKINTHIQPEHCRTNYLNRLEHPSQGIIEITSLCGETEKEEDVQTQCFISREGRITRWFPLSLDITADRDRKYLILLFQGGIDCESHRIGHGPFTGNAYKIDRDVPDFSDPKDSRLYWVRTGQYPCPRSAQILPIEPFE